MDSDRGMRVYFPEIWLDRLGSSNLWVGCFIQLAKSKHFTEKEALSVNVNEGKLKAKEVFFMKPEKDIQR